jgi:hypothetical protein
MSTSLIKIIADGGCYWKRERFDSPGHSIAIPNGTLFNIAVEGPQSHQFVAGKCSDGYFIVDEGTHAKAKFMSANEAVNTVREPSSNAFLHLYFQLSNRWTSADDLRRLETTQLDTAEERALEISLALVRKHPKGKLLDHVSATRTAAKHVARHPQMIDEARRQLAWEANLVASDDGSWLDL